MYNISPDVPSTISLLAPPISLALNLVLVFIIIYLIRRTPKNRDIKTADQKIANVYKEAEFEASELMKDASDKAVRIVEEAGLTKDSLESRLDKSLVQMTDSLIQKVQAKEDAIYNEFKSVFENISQSYQNEGTKIAAGFKEEGDTVLKTFIQIIHAEINSVREQIFARIDDKMKMIDDDLEKYKDSQFQKIDQNIRRMAKGTLDQYLKESLTSENHEQILFKALDKFKNDVTPNTATTSTTEKTYAKK